MERCFEKVKSTSTGREYFVNIETGISRWGLPDFRLRELEVEEIVSDWESVYSFKVLPGRIYHRNASKGISQWDLPEIKYVKKDKPLPSGWEKKLSKCKNVYYINKKLNISQWKIPTSIPTSIPISDDYLAETEPIIIQPRALKWTKNSCYLDSSLFAFFAGPTKFIDEMLNMSLHDKKQRMILKDCKGDDWETNLEHRKAIQDELKKIYKSITRTGTEVEYCTNLRRTLANCPVQENYHTGEIADAGEFITYLTDLFPINKNILLSVNYLTNATGIDLDEVLEQYPTTEKTKIIDAVSLVHVINIDKIKQIRDERAGIANLSDFLTQKEDSGKLTDPYIQNGVSYVRSIQVRSVILSPYLIFSLKRLPYAGAQIDKTIIIPDENISLDGDEIFTLSGAVMHTGGCHYVAVAKYNDVWWYYDDFEYKRTKTLLRFETWKDFLNACVDPYNSDDSNDSDDSDYSPRTGGSLINPLTHGTQFYYSPVDLDLI